MKKLTILLLSLLCAGVVYSQSKPNWFDFADRERNYPNTTFITGFISGNIRVGETNTDAETRLRKEAQAELTEKIRVQVNSEKQKRDTRTKTQTTGQAENEQIHSVFEATITTSSNLELTNVKTDSYTDNNTGLIYGFACVNKYELADYYNASLTMNIQRLESILHTAKQLETNSEKTKARTQYEEAARLLVKIEQEQDVLVALDKNVSFQRDKTAPYRNEIVQALARLAQGVYIYVENDEDLFGQKVDIVANKVKAELAIKGCSFVNTPEQSDFNLRIRVTTRKADSNDELMFCYADASIELYDNHKQKVMYSDEIAQKGGSNSQDKAVRKAMNDVAAKILEKLKPWIE